MGEIRLVEWGPEGADRVRGLLALCFPDNPKSIPGIIEWQYWSNPFGRTRQWVALDGDRLVGHHAAYAVPMHFGHRRLITAIHVDTATDPEYRSRGLYGELSRALYRSCEADGVSFIIGNPNYAAIGALQRMGWNRVSDLSLLASPLQSKWLQKQLKIPRVAATTMTKLLGRRRAMPGGIAVTGVPAGLDELAGLAWGDDDYGVRAGTDWWQWRFANHPARPYRFYEVRSASRLQAALVVRPRESPAGDVIHVLDIVAATPIAARAVIDAAVADAPDAGAITMLTTARGRQGRIARSAGLRVVPPRVRGLRTPFGVRPLHFDLGDPSSLVWSMTGGALDYT